jgi:hypothetical protein
MTVVPAYRDRLLQQTMRSSARHQSMTGNLLREEHLENQCVLCASAVWPTSTAKGMSNAA